MSDENFEFEYPGARLDGIQPFFNSIKKYSAVLSVSPIGPAAAVLRESMQ